MRLFLRSWDARRSPERRSPGRSFFVLWGLLGLSGALSPAPTWAACEAGSVLTVNGGSSGSNACDFVQDIARTGRAFTGARGSAPGSVCRTALLDGGQAAYQQTITDMGCPESSTRIPRDLVSSGLVSKANVREQILATVRATPPGAPVTLYFTDHGGTNSGGSTVAVGDDEIDVEEMRSIIAEIRRERPDQRLIMIHDHCFSGGMLDEIMDATGRVDGNVCGFAASDRHEVALSGQSFARLSDQVASSRYSGMRDAVDRDRDGEYSYGEVFNYYKRSYFTSSGGQGSTPTSSTDVFLENRAARYIGGDSGRTATGSRTELLNSCFLRRSSTGGPLPGISATLRALFEEQVRRTRADLGSLYAGAGLSPSASYASIERLVRSHDGTIERLQDEALLAIQNSAIRQGQIADAAFESAHPAEAARFRELENATNPGLFCGSSLVASSGQSACCAGSGPVSGNEAIQRSAACYNAMPEATRTSWEDEYGRIDTDLKGPAWDAASNDPQVQRFRAEAQSKRARVQTMQQQGQAYRRLYNAVRNANVVEGMLRDASGGDPARAEQAQQDIASYLNLLSCEDTPMGAVPRM